MKKILEWFKTTFGVIGIVLYYLITLFIALMPVNMITDVSWQKIALLFAIEFIPLVNIIVWPWGLVCAIRGPQDAYAIVYYVLFAIFAICYAISVFSRSR